MNKTEFKEELTKYWNENKGEIMRKTVKGLKIVLLAGGCFTLGKWYGMDLANIAWGATLNLIKKIDPKMTIDDILDSSKWTEEFRKEFSESVMEIKL